MLRDAKYNTEKVQKEYNQLNEKVQKLHHDLEEQIHTNTQLLADNSQKQVGRGLGSVGGIKGYSPQHRAGVKGGAGSGATDVPDCALATHAPGSS
jgi:hypothetical protein